MADGGASSFILLTTALLIAGSVSAVLVSQWGEMASAIDQQRLEDEADFKTDFSYAGDLSNVEYAVSNPTDETITFYLQNIGEYELDEESLFIQLNGDIILDTDVGSRIVPGLGTQWTSGLILEVELTGDWNFADNEDIALTIFASSILVAGYAGEVVVSEEVRLNEV